MGLFANALKDITIKAQVKDRQIDKAKNDKH
jgi:hypothetical protein